MNWGLGSRGGRSAVTVAAGVSLVTAAVVVFCGEVIIEVSVAHVGVVVSRASAATSEGSEGEAVKVGFVCHETSMAADGGKWVRWCPLCQVSHSTT